MTPSDKRDDILQAALILFAERGYYGTPVSLIADKAGVGSGTIYRYFKDKDELVNVLYRTWKQTFVEHISKGLDPEQPIRTQFHQVWEALASFALANREAYIFLEAHHHAPYLDQASQTLTEESLARFATIIMAGQEQQIIVDGPPQLLGPLMWAPFAQIMKQHWAGKLELSPEMMAQVEEMCWQSLRR
jgi:AcrR family transcriptional regulator